MSDDSSKLEFLFHTASELEGEDRQRFIDREASEDAELRLELLDLLQHVNSASGARIAGAVERVAARASRGSAWTGHNFGPYRLVREIGRGGMGLVFEAWRDDSEYYKRVALKIAPDWRDLEWLREKFRNERQILAQLEHPNIARFLDGGTENGIPYFAMEYVDGQPLHAWANAHDLSVRERIALFRKVCAGVSYAHENLIIHRDLKPANILVDSAGSPKLLDFGIATILVSLAEKTLTVTGARLWTPDYASPEQVRGESMTVRSDVYSLGLLLYELLCGERAQPTECLSPVMMQQVICETDPDSPSVRAAILANRELSRELRGDLDHIILTAIRKEPERRYNSVNALDADLGRYMEGRPVSARPNTISCRFAKLVSRNRIASAAAALVVLAIGVGIASTAYQARRAERQFQQVRGLASAFIFDVYDRIEYLPGATEARKAVVTTSLRYVQNLRRDAGTDPGLQREIAGAYKRIGEVQGNATQSSLGDSGGALESLRNAESILHPLAARGDEEAKFMLAGTLLEIGQLQQYRGKKDGEQILERAHALIRELLVSRPKDPQVMDLAVEVSSALLRYNFTVTAYDKALEHAREALQIAGQAAAAYPDRAESQNLLAQAQVDLGSAYRAEGDLVKTEEAYRSALAIQQRLVERNPNNTSYRRSLLLAYGHVGDALGPLETRGTGSLSESVDAFEKAAAIAESMARTDPSNRIASFDEAAALIKASADLLEMPGGAPKALAHLSRAETVLDSLLKIDPSNRRNRFFKLSVDALIGKGLLIAGRYGEATRRLETVGASYKDFIGGPNELGARAWEAESLLRLAQIRAVSKDKAPALRLTDEAVAEYMHSDVPKSAWRNVLFERRIGSTYRLAGRNDSAATWFGKSVEDWKRIKVPPILEGRKRNEIAGAEHDLAAAQRGGG